MPDRLPEQERSLEGLGGNLPPPTGRGSERFDWKMAFVLGLSGTTIAFPVTELAIFIRDNFTQVPLTLESASHARVTFYTLGALAGGLLYGYVGGKFIKS